MTQREQVLKTIDNMQEEIITSLMELIRTEPVNPLYDKSGKRSEIGCSQLAEKSLQELEVPIEKFDIDLNELEAYKGKPGYILGFADRQDFRNRPNLLACVPGKDPENGKSLLLSGHLDVVAADDVENWDHPPFEPTIDGDMLYGRGSVDMLSGANAMIMAMKALKRCNIQLKGDLWFSGIVSEEAGGTGGLMTAERLRKKGVKIDAGIMGEPTKLKIGLLCRDIQKVDVIVHGRTGHLEEPQPHWSLGGPVDAIQKARYILEAVDELNREWALRPDKNHPLLPIPCQVKLALIEGGHQRSSYPDLCRLSFNIQVFPHETGEDGLGGKTRKEFKEFMDRVFDSDDWLREHRPEIEWVSESDCSEVEREHPFVACFQKCAEIVCPEAVLGACGFHTDTGWFKRLANIPVINFGPGDPSLAHRTNEKCPVEEIMKAVKMIALAAMDWCEVVESR